MTITYFAVLSNGQTIAQGTDYEAVKAKLDRHLKDYADKHQVWLGGWVQSFR